MILPAYVAFTRQWSNEVPAFSLGQARGELCLPVGVYSITYSMSSKRAHVTVLCYPTTTTTMARDALRMRSSKIVRRYDTDLSFAGQDPEEYQTGQRAMSQGRVCSVRKVPCIVAPRPRFHWPATPRGAGVRRTSFHLSCRGQPRLASCNVHTPISHYSKAQLYNVWQGWLGLFERVFSTNDHYTRCGITVLAFSLYIESGEFTMSMIGRCILQNCTRRHEVQRMMYLVVITTAK